MRELEFRQAAMDFLARRPEPYVDLAYVQDFTFDGERVSLLDPQRGIRKPRQLNAALSIRTVFREDDADRPYADDIGPDGLQRYKYRGDDPEHLENRALRRALHDQLPIIWFFGVARGLYEPLFPVYVIGDDPQRLEFTLAVDEAQRLMRPGGTDEAQRRYAERLTKARLHQPMFRSQVLLAYGGKCSICRLRHVELLDAAHIMADGHPHGQPVVPNGIALCKIHHAAFDASIVGVRPDLTLHVRQDILEETDGWMLSGGIQGVHNRALEVLPRRRSAWPDRLRLEERYADFLAR